MRHLMILALVTLPAPAFTDSVIATQTLRPKEVISPQSVQLQQADIAGAAQGLDDVIGAEVKRAVYSGQPVLTSNLTRAALVERNQIVAATFTLNGLTIATEARAMERGAAGDVIRAMNLTSRAPIRAEVMEDGRLKVLP